MAVTADLVALREPRFDTFDDLYAACQPRVFRTCLAILRNTEDAAEATQEVFSRALPLLTQLREPHVWLQTVARNYCLDQLRRQKVRGGTGVVDDNIAGTGDDPEREALLRDALRQAFEALSPRERRALARVLLMDDSLGDIARMLDISYGAAAQVVSRARRRAALAARAVMGAGFVLLGRIGVSRERDRPLRFVGQLADSGQGVALVAAVVVFGGANAFGGGGVPVPAVSGGGSALHVIAPTAAALHGVDVADVSGPNGGGAALGVPVSVVLPAVPHGLYAVGGGTRGSDRSDPTNVTPPQSTPAVPTVSVTGPSSCALAQVNVGPSTTAGPGENVIVGPGGSAC